MTKAFQFAAIIAVVAGVQWLFSVEFDHDEWERIITTTIGIGGIDALAAMRKK